MKRLNQAERSSVSLSGVFGSRNMRFTQIVLSGSFGAHIMTRGQCDRLSEIS
jgi:hypothetical protein